jgi:protocatechuate 3,4-dioxygenase beta subunit
MSSKTAFGLALILIPLWEASGSATPLRITGLAATPGGSGAGVRVEVSRAFGRRSVPAAAVRPRSDGFFTLQVPEPGVYRAVVRAEGFLPLEIASLPVVEETDLPPVELEPALPLEIRVSGPDGRPAAWVAVCAGSWPGPGSPGLRWEPAERCGTTAEDGRLVLPRGRGERPVLSVTDPRFAARTAEAGEESSVALRLAAARSVPLEVRGPDGKSAAGVVAQLLPSSGRAGITDPAGRLAVAVPESGAEVELVGEGGLRGRAVFVPGLSEETGPRIVTLAAPRMVTGRVIDAATRRPVPGALVWTGEAEARTAGDGTFRLPAGSGPVAVLGAAAADHGRRRAALPWGAGAFTLALPPAGTPPEEAIDPERRRGPPAEELASSRVLTGRVLGPDGRPVSGALVEAARNRTAETDEGGRFRFAGLAPGATVSLSARSPGLQGSLAQVRVPQDAIPAPVEIRLGPAAVLEGRVTDAAGRPVAGAPVLVEGLAADPGEEAPSTDPVSAASARTVTDDDGRYIFVSLKPGRSRAAALRPGGRRLAGAVTDLRAGPNRLDLTQPPELGVSGRVLDEQGAAVAGARIFLQGEDPADRWLVIGAEDGGFRLAGIPEGDYRLSVLAKGFAQLEPRDIQVAGAPVQGIELRLGRAGTIVGNLVGIAPEELNGLMILAQEGGRRWTGREAPPARPRRLGLAGPDGRYRIPDIPPGRWRVMGRTAAGRLALGSVDVAPGSAETALDLRFTSGLTLSGRLLVDGRPASGTVLATAEDLGAGGIGDRGGGQSTTGQDGTFSLSGLQPGTYLLLVFLDNRLWPLRTVELTADREIPLEIVTGTLTGLVLGPYGAPLSGARVALLPRTLGIDAFLPGPRVQSDDQGAFELRRIPAGSHRLLVTRDGAAPFETAVTVPAGGTLRVEIPLGPGTSLQ